MQRKSIQIYLTIGVLCIRGNPFYPGFNFWGYLCISVRYLLFVLSIYETIHSDYCKP